MRYETEERGDVLIIRFYKLPPGRLREALKEYGYRYHRSSGSWVGRRKKDEVRMLLANWSMRCQSMEANAGRRATLCWDCRKACGICSWSKDFTPVDGWKAIRRDLKYQSGHAGYIVSVREESYIVLECPEFERE